MARRTPSKARLAAAFAEIKEDEPSIIAKTRRKKGKAAAQRQRVAIAFSKARRSEKKRDNPGHGRQLTKKTLF